MLWCVTSDVQVWGVVVSEFGSVASTGMAQEAEYFYAQ